MPRRIPYLKGASTARPILDARTATYERSDERRADILWYTSPTWRRVRDAVLAESPLCAECEEAGVTRAASHVHHIAERKDAPDLAYDHSNLRALCASCHSRHHAADRAARRGPPEGGC